MSSPPIAASDIVPLPPGGDNTFGRLKSYSGIIWHTTEGGGFSRAAAVGTRTFQLTNPGSYNFIIYDGGALLTVPYLEASGGINPGSSYWNPGRFPFLKLGLSAAAYADPTMHHLQIALSGKRIDIDRGLMPANMLVMALRLQAWWEAEVANRRTLQSGHMHWQSNRSDPGIVFSTLSARSLPDTVIGDDMPIFIAFTPGTIVVGAGSWVRTKPDLFETSKWTQYPANTTIASFAGYARGEVVEASDQWAAFWVQDSGKWAYTHKSNVLSFVALTGQIVEKIVEKIVEVPTGITQEQLAGAVVVSTAAGKLVGISTEKSRMRIFLGL